MRTLLLLVIFNLSFTPAHCSEPNITNRADSIRPKNWTKENFIKEFGFNDSSIALINLFFIKNKRAKNQTIIGGAMLAGGLIAIADPFEPGDDQKGFGDLVRPVAEPAALALGAILTTSGITKLGKYTRQKLSLLLENYKKGTLIPKKYSKKLKRKFFP